MAGKNPYVTDGQGKAFVVMARGKKVPKEVMDAALKDGRVANFLEGLVLLTPAAKPSILEPLGTATVRATTEPFVARDHFLITTDGPEDAPVKIGNLGELFRKHLLPKTEQPIPESTICAHTLKRDSLDRPILEELGEKATTTLTEFFALLVAQGHGQKGLLLTNGHDNIAYIEDMNGTLWPVRARWSRRFRSWFVASIPVSNSPSRCPGCRVLSRA